MAVPYSSRSQSISPFLAMEVMERGMVMARSGIDIVQLGVGEPGFPPPPEVVEAVARSVVCMRCARRSRPTVSVGGACGLTRSGSW